MKQPQSYERLQDWMNAKGVNQKYLARLAGISEQHLCMVLRGSRRCSLRVALRLSELTGVPVENICQWPKVLDGRTLERVFKAS